VESEHSAMSACVGSASAGARTMTATSSAGFALMWEMLYVAASMRCPIVMTTVNRALSGPINIHCDHSDTMGGRDSGWIQIYNEDAQEAYDATVMSFPIAEHASVRLPVGEAPVYPGLLDPDHPITVGPFDGLHGYYYEAKVSQQRAMDASLAVIQETYDRYAALTGRQYQHLMKYKMDDADIAIIVANSAAGNARNVVDALRAEDIKAGVIKLHTFRPFPAAEYAEALAGCKAVGVMDRADSFGAMGGPLYLEILAALYKHGVQTKVGSFIYGLGGREVFPHDIERAFRMLKDAADGADLPQSRVYLNMKGA